MTKKKIIVTKENLKELKARIKELAKEEDLLSEFADLEYVLDDLIQEIKALSKKALAALPDVQRPVAALDQASTDMKSVLKSMNKRDKALWRERSEIETAIFNFELSQEVAAEKKQQKSREAERNKIGCTCLAAVGHAEECAIVERGKLS